MSGLYSRLGLGLLLLGAAALLFLSGIDGFWFDEIGAARIAWVPADLPGTLFFTHRDNAHYLSILWMRLCGPDSSELLLRLPSLLFGIATLILADRNVKWRHGIVVRLFSMVIWGFSFLAIHYAGEARGYAAILFHSLAALALDRTSVNGLSTRRVPVLKAVNFTAGILSHPLFIAGCFASGLWTAGRIIRRSESYKSALTSYAFPASIVLLTVVVWGMPRSPQGPEGSVWSTFNSFCAWATGGPLIPPSIGLALAVALVLGGPVVLFVRGDRIDTLAGRNAIWFFVPPLLLAIQGTTVVYERYFILILPVLLYSLVEKLAWLWQCKGTLRGAAVAVLFAYVVGQGAGLVPFFRVGRGNYGEAVRLMSQGPTGRPVTVTSDHDFRNEMVLNYYWRRCHSPSPLRYVPGKSAGQSPPEWLIFHDPSNSPKTRLHAIIVFGNPYRLKGHYSKYGLSGWHWYLYRRERQTPR